MRVLIIDDHEVIWGGMRLLLERLSSQLLPSRHMQAVGHRSVESALSLSGEHFDLLLLDYHLPGLSGLSALARVREAFEGVPVVILSADTDPRRVHEAIQQGAAGYVPKNLSERDMQAALERVLAQGVYLPPMVLLDAPEPALAPEAHDLPLEAIEGFMKGELSPRQQQVFARALRGKPNKVIARELGIAEGTVKVHLAMVFRALGVRNRTEAMYKVLSADAMNAIERL